MSLKIGMLMDDIQTIKPYKDSSFAMMLSAQERGHEVYYFQQHDVFVESGVAFASVQRIHVTDGSDDYYALQSVETIELSAFDCILMRKDPPFDMEFVYTTYMLEMAERLGTLVVNPPHALRAINEKFSIVNVADVAPHTLITRDMDKVRAFVEDAGKAVVKPMGGMGGQGIFKLGRDDANMNAILESLGNGSNTLMVQAYLENVTRGDKRILLVDGQIPQHGLARIPQGKEFRANLAAGGRGEVQALTPEEVALCERIVPWIKEQGLIFVGLDVIDSHVTEINVTSPTCIREIANETGEDIAERLIMCVERRCAS